MQRTLLILIVWALSSWTSLASANVPEVDSWFADYDELMQMNEGDRKAYLSEVRNILVDYEYNTHESLGAYKAAMIDFSIFLPEADAAPAKEAKICTKPGEVLQHINNESFCLVNARPNAKGECPDGSDVVARTNGGREFKSYTDLCYTKRVSAEGAIEQICKSSMMTSCKTNPKTNKVECDCLPDPSKPAPPKVAEAKPEATAPSSKGVDGKPGKPGAIGPGPAKNGEPGAPGKPGTPPDTAPPKTAAKPTDKAPPKAAEHKEPTPPAPKLDCRAAAPSCEDGGEKAREEFFLQKRACVYAGNISKYRKKKPAKGDCEPVTSVTLGEKATYSCTEGVLCNPLVYCVPKADDTKGYCSKNKGSSTAKCDSIAPKSPDCLNKLLATVPRETWNGFLKSLKQVCSTDQSSAKYHCKECSIMYRRVFALNAKYTKSVCSKGDSKGKADPTKPVAPAASAAPAETSR